MTFFSILNWHHEVGIRDEEISEPNIFLDLHLDQVVNTLTTGYEEYNLKPFFYNPVKNIDTVKYRQNIFKELEEPRVFEVITSFSKKMQLMREHLTQAEKLHYTYQKESWFLDAVEIYCDACQKLANDLSHLDLKSDGFLEFSEYLTNYTKSDEFTSLLTEIKQLKKDFSEISYCLHIKGKEITVQICEYDEGFYPTVQKTFQKFLQEPDRYFHERFSEYPEMNHVEAKILELVAALNQEQFSRLDRFQKERTNYLNNTVGRFDREIQFYVAYLNFIQKLKEMGLPFSTPEISETSKDIQNCEGFDLALAIKLIHIGSNIVQNDFFLKDKERIFVITGPNQGGKTTFARTFGQLHYLGNLGCPVPGKKARLYHFDRIFTHFEQEEDIDNLRSKLEDDLERIYTIFTQATSKSIIIINEMFTSTTIQDALFLGTKVLEKAIELDILCIYVTFLDELTTLEKTVSMVSTVNPENPDERTYKIVRRPADGLSYAIAIARKNRLTYENIVERIQS